MTESEVHEPPLSPGRVGGVIIFAILFLPFTISGSPDNLWLSSGVWLLIVNPISSGFIILQPEVLSSQRIVLDIIPQFLFVYMMIRLYEGKTTGRRTFLAWFIGVSNQLLTFVMNSLPLLWDSLWPYAFKPILIPSSLLVAVLIVHFYPPPSETIPWKETKPWWSKT
ncbi:MAG: hypothetical protein JSW61_12315 [Candidatus Thorarchaeota archaeon]|nr:MAG: hypothetical protein JSW61_12315 [Candidatus Thorarchaeota archaeon]